MAGILQKIFGTKQDREIRRMQPVVNQVNDILTALHDYTSEHPPITHLVGMSTEEIISQAAEFEKRWSQLTKELSAEDPEYQKKLRRAEEEAGSWFSEGDKGEKPVMDWRAVYWGIQSQLRESDSWAAAGDDWLCEHLEEREGKPIYRELKAELDKKEEGAFQAWLDAKNKLSQRVRPALVARTRAWQKSLGDRAEEIAAKAKQVDEDHRQEYRRKQTNQVLEPIMVEGFSLVREACYLLLGSSWDVRGFETTWDMFPFNVQIIGAVVLHEGKIAEMRTGEGKTLVATMPLYLNALMGRGAHLVTVNDYLAARDREWMGPIYEYLGLSVGVIQSGMMPAERQPEYSRDITYGTNNEFGFDYLRDNMVITMNRKVQPGHAYAIVDEVDSVLVDEARTPLIISGPTEYVDRGYMRYKPGVERVYRAQHRLSTERVAEAQKLASQNQEMKAAKLLLMVKRSTPKHKKLLRILKEGSMNRLVEDTENALRRDKNLTEVIDDENYFTYEEHDRTIYFNEKGTKLLNPNDPDFLTLPDLSTGLSEIDHREDLAPKQKLKLKDELNQEWNRVNELLNNHIALLKAYVLFDRDEDYIVAEGKVVIVDPFTGRAQPGRRYSDGLHEALEAKEGVRVQEETQTVATITHQNYFRMYDKLAGMTGTALTEAGEFWDIYNLEVLAVPTNKPVRRLDYADIVYKTRNEKYRALMEEIEHWHQTGRPILVGTTSVDVSETLSRMLKRHGINHNVLNAKHHQREAEIVREAGNTHKVTIATNMAGRGTDIKLTPDVLEIPTDCRVEEARSDAEVERIKRTSGCQDDIPTGLLIIGTERHESRRIDNQLRGRSGRQGDPGVSRFFLSLEDDLLRIFGADRMNQVIERFGGKDMEPISSPLVTRAIENAQKRVEQNNFQMRKRLLEFDDVMNRQREIIYSLRDDILAGEDLEGLCKDIYMWVIEDLVDTHCMGRSGEEWDWEGLEVDFVSYFMTDFRIPEPEERLKFSRDELVAMLTERAEAAFGMRRETLGDEKFPELQNLVLLTTIDRQWRDHLLAMDELKKGIGLRGYGQKDPLIEYKKESTETFAEMVSTFRRDVTKLLFRAQLKQAPVRRQAPVHAYKEETPEAAQAPQPGQPQTGQQTKPKPVKAKKKVGRNDPCPCGSGKKYKKCCYPKYG